MEILTVIRDNVSSDFQTPQLSSARHIFNPHLGVGKSDETLSLVFDILHDGLFCDSLGVHLMTVVRI